MLVDSECNLAESVGGRLAQQYISSKVEEVEYQIRKFPSEITVGTPGRPVAHSAYRDDAMAISPKIRSPLGALRLGKTWIPPPWL